MKVGDLGILVKLFDGHRYAGYIAEIVEDVPEGTKINWTNGQTAIANEDGWKVEVFTGDIFCIGKQNIVPIEDPDEQEEQHKEEELTNESG